MKGISCQCLSTMYIFDLWMNNEYIYIYVNCKLINIVIYFDQNIDFFFYFISDNTSDLLNIRLVRLVFFIG